jgi:hypothetical protein
MNTSHLRALCVAFLLFMALSAQAQLNITEYFTMGYGFKLDLNNRATEKAIYLKGVLDIQWHQNTADLSITYDPREIDIMTIIKNLLKTAGGEVVFGTFDLKEKFEYVEEKPAFQAKRDEQR